MIGLLGLRYRFIIDLPKTGQSVIICFDDQNGITVITNRLLNLACLCCPFKYDCSVFRPISVVLYTVCYNPSSAHVPFPNTHCHRRAQVSFVSGHAVPLISLSVNGTLPDAYGHSTRPHRLVASVQPFLLPCSPPCHRTPGLPFPRPLPCPDRFSNTHFHVRAPVSRPCCASHLSLHRWHPSNISMATRHGRIAWSPTAGRF